MKHLLDLAVRTYCGLWESCADVTPSTPWSWEMTREALSSSTHLGPELIQEWEQLSERERDTALRVLSEFHPLAPGGDVVRFEDSDGVQRFEEAVVASDIMILGDNTLDVVGGPGVDSLVDLARKCGGSYLPSVLQEHYAWVDIEAPHALLSSGMGVAEAAGLLSEAVQGNLTEAALLGTSGEGNRFAGRLARFVRPRRKLGGREVLNLAAERGGELGGLNEGELVVEFSPKSITAKDIDSRDILENPGSSAFHREVKRRVEEANEIAALDAAEAARAFAASLEKDHLSWRPSLEENRVRVAVSDKTIAGVPDWLVEEAKRSGLMDVDTAAKLLLFESKDQGPNLLTEEEGGSSVGPGGAAKSAGDTEGERGGVSHEQPDVKAGRTAQSQSEPQQEPEKPTEHRPTEEEGAPGGDVKLADGTTVPEPVMKDAMAKLLKNLATQLQQDTETDGQPQEPQGDEEEPGEEEPGEEGGEQGQEGGEQQPQATQKGAPQPTNTPAETAVSGEEGSGKMAESITDIARKILSGQMTASEALGETLGGGMDDRGAGESDLQKRRAARSQVQKDEMESVSEGAWVDDLQKIVPHVESGLKAAGYRKDDEGYWREKDGTDKIELCPTPFGLILKHCEGLAEQLDMGQAEEGQQILAAIAEAADAMKMLRAAAFALSTNHLVRIASMAKSLGAAPAATEAEGLQKEVEKFVEDMEPLAKRLNKIHDKVKGKAGGDASTLQTPEPDTTPPAEEPAPEPAPEPGPEPEQASATDTEAAAGAADQPMAEGEKAIREAVARCARTDIPAMIWEGESYNRIRRYILKECRDLPLDADQVIEVRNRMRRLEGANVDQVYAIELSEGDKGLMVGVSAVEGDAPQRVVQAAEEGRGVSSRTLSEAVDALRRYGELEHRLLAEALDKQVMTALSGAE